MPEPGAPIEPGLPGERCGQHAPRPDLPPSPAGQGQPHTEEHHSRRERRLKARSAQGKPKAPLLLVSPPIDIAEAGQREGQSGDPQRPSAHHAPIDHRTPTDTTRSRPVGSLYHRRVDPNRSASEEKCRCFYYVEFLREKSFSRLRPARPRPRLLRKGPGKTGADRKSGNSLEGRSPPHLPLRSWSLRETFRRLAGKSPDTL